MLGKKLFTATAIIFSLFISGLNISAQSPDEDGRRFEVGAQFSMLNLSTVKAASLTTTPCLVPPCSSVVTIDYERETEPGFGGRISYHFNNYLALEAEANFFPRDRASTGGRAFEGLFGVKAGWRFQKVGIFAKARPGFFSARNNNYRLREGSACVAVFPPPIGCFEVRGRETSFAFDIGGGIEFYPTKRSIIRFDAGDTIIRFDQQFVKASSTVFPAGVALQIPARTSHNFQAGMGVGFRF